MLVSEISNIVLSATLLPPVQPDQAPFATSRTLEDTDTVQADHIDRLVAEAVQSTDRQLIHFSQGRHVLDQVEREANKWLAEIIEPVALSDDDHGAGRRDSLFTIGGGAFDEEIELTVTVLVSLICGTTDHSTS